MTEARAERRLTTILGANVVGYSRLMAADEDDPVEIDCFQGTCPELVLGFAMAVN